MSASRLSFVCVQRVAVSAARSASSAAPARRAMATSVDRLVDQLQQTRVAATPTTVVSSSASSVVVPAMEFSSSAAVSAAADAMKLPTLPYAHNALEPVISGQIMELHHLKHHQAYATNFGVAREKYVAAQEKGDAAGMLEQLGALKFNGGGFVNHCQFWENLCPVKDYTPPEGDLKKRIDAQFGSLDAMQTKLSAMSAGVQGSGWGWLAYSPASNQLVLTTTPNQDTLGFTHGTGVLVPLLGLDVWEHAYYLDYKNARPDYLKAIWKVVNWRDVASRLAKASAAQGK